jgi:hypothetical protein
VWNHLPSNVVACSTVYSFKHEIDSILGHEGFM